MGKCPSCGVWDSLDQETLAPATKASGFPAGSRPVRKPVPLNQIDQTAGFRESTGSAELNRVLGGGLRDGMVVLIGGEPGIGKSTLMLQTLGRMAEVKGPALYVSGEESNRQIKLRADRLGIDSAKLLVLAETNLELITAWVRETKPGVAVIDSVQTLTTDNSTSAPGGVTQLRECTARLAGLAKERGLPLLLVGHVTKSGALAGPKVVEHMVDTVLYFEGGEDQGYRILRTAKNRFGSTNEIGVFEMTGKGLKEVANPSELFLAGRPVNEPGSVVVPCLEGTRPVLVEIQALASATTFAQPKRTALGVDPGRVALLAAVLEKKIGLPLSGHDLFVNVTGGLKITEPAADLGLALAMASSLLDQPLDPATVVMGEVGLTGEIRTVARAEQRLAEARKLGFTTAILPARAIKKPPSGLKIEKVTLLGKAIKRAIG